MGKSAPSAPPAPDYTGAAKATAAGDLDAARSAANANRVNQVTPYGSLTYSHDPNAGDPDLGWTATTKLSPIQQQLLDQQNNLSVGVSKLGNQGLGYLAQALSSPITMSSLPASAVNPGQTGQDALMARFQPMIDQQHKALDTQLANQGIMPGSEAYTNAMRTQNQSENDLRSQAALNGISVGQNAQNQQMQLLSALQDHPLNQLNSLRSGAQITNPTFTSVPQQATTGGADLLGAANAQAGYNTSAYNRDVAQQNQNTQNTASMAGLAIGMF